eukprot:CAMPEP_0119306352 /NCGR_PEP_ID=MMETSP1333-20130426/7136_1 /TAXON_ID=418940 /ORGANISM="Scyphosphaera apsteinii, Strain RCC1455" /LENGTH=141 /DNA_ID=CAMNT_0007309631 /DNA_START=213 /DNA_END=638 /DNA_ORIENTATION=+
MQDDLNAAFAAQVKKDSKANKLEAEKKQNDSKNRLGPRLDLTNRPQNFFKGLAERDEKRERDREQGLEYESAPLMSESDRNIWIGGFALAAALFVSSNAFTALDQQAYQSAVDNNNYALTNCLDMAFSNSEKNICRIKFSN